MGFDVVYLPPIHPIGTSFRKTEQHAHPRPDRSGVALGDRRSRGRTDAIHPDLGDFDAFDRFVAKAKSLGLEVAMDFALRHRPITHG